MTDKTKQRRLITADLLDAVDALINECKYTDDGRPAVSRHTLERAVKAFNVAQDQWTNEAKELGMPQAFQCILCNFTYLDEANRDKCFAQHRHAIETQTDDSEDLPVTLEQSNESLEHAINTVCNTTTRLAIDAEYRKQIKMRYEADRAKTFTFHLPAHDHDEVQVKAPDLATAREMLYDWVERGMYAGEEVVVLRENTDDGSARHWKEEVNDAPAFDENGDQIDN